MSKTWMILGTLAITVTTVVVAVGYWGWRMHLAISDAYMLEWVSIMVAEHIKSTGKLPVDWNELNDEYRQLPQHVGDVTTSFAELQQNIDIDFRLSIEAVGKSERDDVHYLRLKSGQSVGLSNPVWSKN